MPKFMVPFSLEYTGAKMVEADSIELAIEKVSEMEDDELMDGVQSCDVEIHEDAVEKKGD